MRQHSPSMATVTATRAVVTPTKAAVRAGSGAEHTGPVRPAGAAGIRLPAAWAALVVVWVVWGSTYVALRVGDESIPPLALAGVRYLAAGAVLLPVALRAGGPAARAADRPGPRQWLGMAVVGVLLLAFGNGSVTVAERTIPAGLAALLVATVPIWMVLADRVLNGTRPPPAAWLALVAGIAGIAILARPPGHGSPVPVLLVLAGSLSWGTGSVLAGRLPGPARPLLGSAMQMLAGGALLTVAAAATGELSRLHPGLVSGRSLLALLYLIGPGSLLAMTCYLVALRGLPTASVSTYAYVNPVIAVGLGAALLGERLTPATLAGGTVVLASVALLLAGRNRRPADLRSCQDAHPDHRRNRLRRPPHRPGGHRLRPRRDRVSPRSHRRGAVPGCHPPHREP
jgi:drug/metabolite transporter (DMT)-like permease